MQQSPAPYVPVPRARSSEKVGGREWPIIWEYTYRNFGVPGGWSNTWVTMQRALHRAELYENGDLTIFKGHEDCAVGACMTTPIRIAADANTAP